MANDSPLRQQMTMKQQVLAGIVREREELERKLVRGSTGELRDRMGELQLQEARARREIEAIRQMAASFNEALEDEPVPAPPPSRPRKEPARSFPSNPDNGGRITPPSGHMPSPDPYRVTRASGAPPPSGPTASSPPPPASRPEPAQQLQPIFAPAPPPTPTTSPTPPPRPTTVYRTEPISAPEPEPVPSPAAFCQHCGTRLEAGARFCGKCGTPVGASAPRTVTAERPLPPGSAGTYAPPYAAGPSITQTIGIIWLWPYVLLRRFVLPRPPWNPATVAGLAYAPFLLILLAFTPRLLSDAGVSFDPLFTIDRIILGLGIALCVGGFFLVAVQIVRLFTMPRPPAQSDLNVLALVPVGAALLLLPQAFAYLGFMTDTVFQSGSLAGWVSDSFLPAVPINWVAQYWGVWWWIYQAGWLFTLDGWLGHDYDVLYLVMAAADLLLLFIGLWLTGLIARRPFPGLSVPRSTSPRIVPRPGSSAGVAPFCGNCGTRLIGGIPVCPRCATPARPSQG